MYSSVQNPVQTSILGTLNASSSPPPTSPTSPTRRLRGLSYLRSYTQSHILSRDSHNNTSTSSNSQQRPSTLARATSYPSQTHSPSQSITPQILSTPKQTIPEASSAQTTNTESTSGWFPTVGGQSAVSRIPTEPQPTATALSSAVISGNIPPIPRLNPSAPMARTRSATAGAALDTPDANAIHEAGAHTTVNGDNKGMAHQLPSIRFSAHQDPRAQRPSLVFSPMARILPTGKEIIKVGRYSERENQPTGAPNVPSSAPVGFKSKVVSRRHCEFWYTGGRWFIKDVKSSSGTFLNHIRLSSPGAESRPFPINDGDIVQLGIDFKGGEENIFRCVKIRVELNKGWQTGPSSFNVQSHRRLRELNNLNKHNASGSSQDCSICLGPIAPCQSLFVAPCSHTWHYKCIRVIINGPHWPHFICPNCRSVADLEAELEDPTAGEWEEIEMEEESAAAQPLQAEEPILSTPQHANDSAGIVQEARQGSAHEISGPSDLDVAETSDDSDIGQAVARVADSMRYVDLDESPSREESAEPLAASNATSAPVDIIPRKAVGTPSARLGQPESTVERQSTRTPSPNGLGSSLDIMTGHEGPMTPRNDAGPFIFDGSAGRASGTTLAAMATMNLAAAADSPQPTPNPA